MLQTLYIISSELATFNYVKNTTREIKQERSNIIITNKTKQEAFYTQSQ